MMYNEDKSSFLSLFFPRHDTPIGTIRRNHDDAHEDFFMICLYLLAFLAIQISSLTPMEQKNPYLLHEAAARDDVVTVTKLLSGADVNATDEDEQAPLQRVARNGHVRYGEIIA